MVVARSDNAFAVFGTSNCVLRLRRAYTFLPIDFRECKAVRVDLGLLKVGKCREVGKAKEKHVGIHVTELLTRALCCPVNPSRANFVYVIPQTSFAMLPCVSFEHMLPT